MRLAVVLLHLSVCGYFRLGNVQSVNYKVAVVGQFAYRVELTATMRLALKRMRLRNITSSTTNFDIIYKDGCGEYDAHARMAEAYLLDKAQFFLGPPCSAGTTPAAQLASFWNVPIVGFSGNLGALSDKQKYPTFARVSTAYDKLGEVVVTVLNKYQWKRVAVAHTSCSVAMADVKLAMTNAMINITYEEELTNVTAQSGPYLQKARQVARVFITCFSLISLSTSRIFMQAAHDLQMADGSYAFIILVPLPSDNLPQQPWKANDTRDAEMFAMYQYVLVLHLTGPHTNKPDMTLLGPDYRNEVNSVALELNLTYPAVIPTFWMANVHDGFMLYGAATKNLNANSSIEGKDMFNRMKCAKFEGASGDVVLDKNAERLASYWMLAILQPQQEVMSLHMSVSPPANPCTVDVVRYSLQVIEEKVWLTPSKKPPLDTPLCGYKGEKCITDQTVINAILFCLLVIAMCATAQIMYMKRVLVRETLSKLFTPLIRYRDRVKREKELHIMSWRVAKAELLTHSERNVKDKRKEAEMTGSMVNVVEERPDSSKSSTPRGENEKPVYYYRNEAVSLTSRGKRKKVDPSFQREDLRALKLLEQCHHENLQTFYGLCVDDDKYIHIVWSLSGKGTLQEILFNNDIMLDIMFKVSLLRDLTKGLEFLHKSDIGYHGVLNTENCCVDARWNLQLKNFGTVALLSRLQERGILKPTEHTHHELYHVAPELLRGDFQLPNADADIYSLGILFCEILGREPPYADQNLMPDEILYRIKYPTSSGQIRPTLGDFRPNRHDVAELDVISTFITLMKHCWDENRDLRPTIDTVRKAVLTCTKSFSNDLMDHMVEMLEKHATNLEKTVSERTKQVEDERSRADKLLYQIIPAIAEALKAGRPVLPDSYSAATVFFSNIVGFSDLCSGSTPLQVVTMMNALNTGFDNVISEFDVYKVDTIRDAYLVVSGVPKPNGQKHATEIADMAIKIMEYVRLKFHPPHLPTRTIALRIGINSGPLAAGIIGTTMPRYCVFGDTVNVASRLQSHGEPMKIHISESTKALLEAHPQYHIENRGETELRGKGIYVTYWLDKASDFETFSVASSHQTLWRGRGNTL